MTAIGNRLEGKVAVVTGGANGIGRACAERFGAEGARVVIADVADTDAALRAVEVTGAEAIAMRVDAASPTDNEALMLRAVEQFGGIDVLVTAAGVSHADYCSGDVEGETSRILARLADGADLAERFADLALDDWQRVIDINLTGTFLAVQSAVRRMLTLDRPGSIITLASIAAKDPEAGPLPYAVSKSGVWMLTKHAARALGPRHIRINAIGPGFIDTNMTTIFGQIPGARDLIMAKIPLGRIGAPDEVAAVALFLASDDSSYVTGQIIHPDGGWFTG